MKTQEIRIGNLLRLTTKKNWIYGDRDGKLPEGVHSVKSISDKGINYTEFENVYWNDLENYEGIPITADWIEKLGFTKDEPYYVKNKIAITKNMIRDGSGNYNGFYTTLQSRDPLEKNYIQLLYIHQLQNLYFALTGEELTIKP